MPQFRKKPVVVTAEQFKGYIQGSVLPDGITIKRNVKDTLGYYRDLVGIETPEGFMECKPGDWIITGVAGEKYPCKDAIFKQTYEPVEAEEMVS